MFGAYSLAVPPTLECSTDGHPGSRVLFLTDRDETILISFEEGMACMDMNPQCTSGRPMVSYTACSGDKYIHQKRTFPDDEKNRGCFAFFHIEARDSSGKRVSIPGQMTAPPGYRWADGVEPVLLDIMNGIDICKIKDSGGA